MPTNLNALIRYKTIDKCLGNRSVKCSIRRLREECSEALGEKRGVYKTVSERTIRDDIRVMRSDILGFNAPIAFEDGCYFYTERDYSIFETYLKGRELLHSVYQTLLEQRESVEKSVINEVLFRLSQELDIDLPLEIYKELSDERLPRKPAEDVFEQHPDNRFCEVIPPVSEQIKQLKESLFRHQTDFAEERVTYRNVNSDRINEVTEIHEDEFLTSFPWHLILDKLEYIPNKKSRGGLVFDS